MSLKVAKKKKEKTFYFTHFPKQPNLSVRELYLFLSEYACTISLKVINLNLCFQPHF